MTSPDWRVNVAYEAHQASKTEVCGLLAHAARCLADGRVDAVSAETRHAVLHGAIALLAKAALAADGLQTTESHHYWGIESLGHTVGLSAEDVSRLHAHRKKRHRAAYEYDGAVSDTEADDLLTLATAVDAKVRGWLGTEHPDLIE